MFKRSLSLVFYFTAFVAVGAVAAFLVLKLIGFGETVEVPALAGKTVAEAESLLISEKLSLEVEGEEFSLDVAEGNIIGQDIEPGTRVKRNSVIKVVVSKGEAMLVIPYFEGMNINDVKLTIAESEMALGKITSVHSDTVGKGLVIAQRPLPGDSRDKKVSLLVSLGPYEVSYKCPSFVNMTIDEARTMAKALGIKLREKNEGNMVVVQKPEADTIIKKGDVVEITLGRGGWFWF